MSARPLRLLALLLALPLLLLGCDTAEDDPMFQDNTILEDALVVINYLFDESDFDANGTATVQGNQSVLINGLLPSSFSRTDIVSISGLPGSGELLIRQPPLANIDEVASAELRFENLLVATAQVTMTDDDEELRIADTDLTSLGSQSGFNSTLTITLADPSAAQDYELEARVTLRFELEP
ncbi:MAG: hypothetical protein AAGG50_19815 [Bacteroidota bacterium]